MQCKQAVMADANAGLRARAVRQANRAGRQAKQGSQSPVQHRSSSPQGEREGTEKEVQRVMH